MQLDTSNLRKAIDTLERSLRVADEAAGSSDRDLMETVRAGVIQNFEMAYEQSWKFIQRWLRENQTPEDADYPRTRKELFRMAARHGLINDPLPWFSYGDARNLASHTYNTEQAVSVYNAVKRFLPDAKALLARLEALHD